MVLAERFELGRRLGQGAFGTTHLARERATGRAVAVKCLPLAGLSEWKPVEMFEREARVLRSLDHPGVPEFVAAFEDDEPGEGPRFYIVSEYIEGPTLQAEIEGGRRWSPEQARALLGELLATLEYLHSLSPRVIHRDIKPGNIVLRANEHPVLVDFGSVRDAVARQAGGGMTIAGTAGYMAPEQAAGISDVRSDLYGLGATMAHVLTHVHPSELPREGLRPRLRDLAGVDPALERILERLLEPDPERRFGSAAEVLRALAGAAGDPGASALARREGDESVALVPREIPSEAALARLVEGPRTVGRDIEKRLDYTRAFRSSLPTAGGVMLAGMAVAAVLAIAGAAAFVMPAMFAAIGAFFVAPLPRRRRSRRLYAAGAVTRGKILVARSEDGSLFVSYAFRHGEREFTGNLLTNDAFVANRVAPDTPVFVFYDPERPTDNVGLLPEELPAELRAVASA